MSGKQFTGKIISDKMDKTVVVSVEVHKKHPIYRKALKNTRKFKAHNEAGAKIGDIVCITECRPYSKDVTWAVTEIQKNKEVK